MSSAYLVRQEDARESALTLVGVPGTMAASAESDFREDEAMTPRRERLERLRSGEVWDVAIIGGGATGLGAAVDAASRGYRTVLLERDDFAKGTSSRSTKLVHGGVRYLAQRNFKLVREALRERGQIGRAHV